MFGVLFRPILEEIIHNWTPPDCKTAMSRHVDEGNKQKEDHFLEQTTLVTSGSLLVSGREENLILPINIETKNCTRDENVVCLCDSHSLKYKPDFFCWEIPDDQQRILDNISDDADRKEKLIPSTEQSSLAPSDNVTYSEDSLINVQSFSPEFHLDYSLNLPHNKTVTKTQNDSTTDEDVCLCDSQTQILKSKPLFHYWIIPDGQKKLLDAIPEWKSSYQPSPNLTHPSLSSSSCLSYGNKEADNGPGNRETQTNTSFDEHHNRTNSVIKSQDNRTNSVIKSQDNIINSVIKSQDNRTNSVIKSKESTQTNISVDKVNSGSLFSDIEENCDKHINSYQCNLGRETLRLSNNIKGDRKNKTCRRQQSQTCVLPSEVSVSSGKHSTLPLSETSYQGQGHSDPSIHQLSSNFITDQNIKCDLSLQPSKQVVRIPVVELCHLDCRLSQGSHHIGVKRVCKAFKLQSQNNFLSSSHSQRSLVNSQIALKNGSLNAIMSFISSGNKAGFIHE